MDDLGDRFLMRLGAIAVWCCWFIEGRSLVRESVDDLGDRFVMRLEAIAYSCTSEIYFAIALSIMFIIEMAIA